MPCKYRVLLGHALDGGRVWLIIDPVTAEAIA